MLKAIKWFFAALALLFIMAIATLILAPDTWLRTIAGDKGSAQLGRPLTIGGPIKIDWDWAIPAVHLQNITIANLPGSKDPNMINIDRIDFHIKIWKLLEGQLNLPDITLVKPRIVLEKKADGSKNWDFPTLSKTNAAAHAALPTSRSNVPMLGLLTIENGTLIYRDQTQNLDLNLGIDSAKGTGTEGDEDFKLSGTGLLQNKPFSINAEGGSLSMLRNSNAVYPLDLHVQMGKTVVAVKGTFTDPVKMDNLDAVLSLSGDSFADLFYLTAMPLPPTPPYHLSGHLTKNGDLWHFADFKGLVGQSDMAGDLSYDTSGARSLTKADLTSKMLRMTDLKGLIGVKNDAPSNTNTDRVLPDMPLDLSRMRASDMDIRFRAAHIDQPGWPLDNLDVRFDLKNGTLRLDPLSFGVADGKISGQIILDGSADVPKVNTDLTMERLSLKPFFTDTQFASFSTGRFGGKVKLQGNGKSLAQVLGDSDGRITFIMSGGTVSKLIINAAGLDFGHATPELLGGDEPTKMRCAIGDFGVKDGLLTSDVFVIDTEASNIDGKTSISLKNETIDASIEGHPKHLTLAATTPITIGGPFRHPSVGLDPKEITGRGVAAAALSIFLPPAAIIPFIELGLGKDSDCQHYIDEARAHAAQAPTAK